MHAPSSSTLGEIVATNPAAARTLDRLGLDYCCHGYRTLADACMAVGLDPVALMAELEALPVDGDCSWSGMEPAALVDHIVATHHRYLDVELPLLEALATKVFTVHAERHPELSEVKALVEAIRGALEPHLRVEEELLFPAIHRGPAGAPDPRLSGLAELVQAMEAEHDLAGDLLAALRRVTSAYEVPPDACASYRSLFERLEALELDTHLHVLKENHALLPALRRIAVDS